MLTYRDAFMSHAHTDNAECADYAMRLKAKGVDVWIDLHSLQDGHFLGQAIQGQLQRRRAFILMMSPDSLASFWVNLEMQAYLGLMARDLDRLMVPVRIQPCEVPPFMNAFKWIDAVGKPRDQVADEIAVALALQDDRNPWDEIAIPADMYDLGFRGWRVRATGVEFLLPPTRDVAGGPFAMGSAPDDPLARDDEKPQYRIPVAAFQIATFPVTVAEYAKAVQAGAVPAPPTLAFPDAEWVAPAWRDKELTWAMHQQQRYRHPVVGVSWLNAMDYAAWLAQVTGQGWRLPTEAEWEKAARWDAPRQVARVWPWGDEFGDGSRANTREKGPGMTTPVGTYPQGASPCGAQDMAGNVREWCSSLDKPYPYDANVSENDGNRTSARVLRGGSWYVGSDVARAADRYRDLPSIIVNDVGARLLLAAGAGA